VQTVLPAYLLDGQRTWQSTSTNATYYLDWIVELADGSSLNLSTVRDDQELADESAIMVTYEGFVHVQGRRGDCLSLDGYGMVEIEPASS
jgi:hypothetical protein